MKELNYYFDFLSPFSFFAWRKLNVLKTTLPLKIHFYPIALGPVLNHWGIKGPGEVTPKREFLLKQMLRYAALHQFEFTTPKTHPFNSLYALRLSLFSVAGELQEKVIDTLWTAGWQKRIDMADPQELVRSLEENHLPGEDLYERSFSQEARTELKANIQQAISLGVFGVPSFVVDQELFWGADSMDDLVNFIQGNDSLDLDKYHYLRSSTPRMASQSL